MSVVSIRIEVEETGGQGIGGIAYLLQQFWGIGVVSRYLAKLTNGLSGTPHRDISSPHRDISSIFSISGQ